MTESQEPDPSPSLYEMVAELYEPERQKASMERRKLDVERDKFDLWRQEMADDLENRATDHVVSTASVTLALGGVALTTATAVGGQGVAGWLLTLPILAVGRGVVLLGGRSAAPCACYE